MNPLIALRLVLALSFGILLAGAAGAGVQLQFDYTYDSHGFFNDPERRDVLEAAGRVVNRYLDDLPAIEPTDTNRWSMFFSPPDGSPSQIINDLVIPEDTLRIYVAGRPLSGRLAQSIDAPGVPSGTSEWQELVRSRGQTGANGSPSNDFGPWGGTISFNQNLDEVPWYFGLDEEGIGRNQFDFLTVAMHEILHLLGVGIAHSFADQVNHRGEFTGSHSVQVGSPSNSTLQLDDTEAHWRRNTTSPWNGELQEALMAPAIAPGQRQFPTRLDRAALVDIGWEPALPGDANLDRQFDTQDLVTVFRAGLFETNQLAGWSDGDWNDNGLFESGDLVEALQTGTFEQGPLSAQIGSSGPAAALVPEPTGWGLALSSGALLPLLRRRLRTS